MTAITITSYISSDYPLLPSCVCHPLCCCFGIRCLRLRCSYLLPPHSALYALCYMLLCCMLCNLSPRLLPPHSALYVLCCTLLCCTLLNSWSPCLLPPHSSLYVLRCTLLCCTLLCNLSPSLPPPHYALYVWYPGGNSYNIFISYIIADSRLQLFYKRITIPQIFVFRLAHFHNRLFNIINI